MKKGFIQFIIGVIMALAGAIIMLHGNLFEEYNTGVAIVLGIIGIGLIATSKFKLLGKK